jgi:hypothetical protein
VTAWTSLTNADQLLSMKVPLGWDVSVVDEFHFLLYSDVADADDYHASVTVAMGEPEEAGPEWFARFCAAVPGQLASTIEGFELLGTDRFMLSSGTDVFELRAGQHATGAPATTQVQAYLWAGSYRMYVFSAATRREHEDRDLPIFEEILHSIRVLPPRR